MTKEQPIEIFMPPNMLKAKVGGRVAGVDMAAIKRAERALDNLKSEFSDWISADVAALGAAYDAYRVAPETAQRDALYRASHDLRGQALTFEFPLVASVATALCKLLDGYDGAPPLALIDAHVNAIRVVVRQNIKDAQDEMAKTLVETLDARVDEFLEKSSAKQTS